MWFQLFLLRANRVECEHKYFFLKSIFKHFDFAKSVMLKL